MKLAKPKIKYPYLPNGRIIKYSGETNIFMQQAKEFARQHSLDRAMPGAAVVVKKRRVIGKGANGSDYHDKHGCQRVSLGCKTGEGYKFCEGCHPKNHSESRAIKDAQLHGHDTRGASLYLWGHWWCCRWCWDVMIGAGIYNVFLMRGSEILFNKKHPDNIVGRQFQ